MLTLKDCKIALVTKGITPYEWLWHHELAPDAFKNFLIQYNEHSMNNCC